MVVLKSLFGRKRPATESRQTEPESIPPAQFRKEDFAFDSFQEVSAAEAQRMVEQEDVQVLDVRFEYEYRSHPYSGSDSHSAATAAGALSGTRFVASHAGRLRAWHPQLAGLHVSWQQGLQNALQHDWYERLQGKTGRNPVIGEWGLRNSDCGF